MKGIAHFTVGVAVASCFPEAVSAGAEGHPLYLILGGVCGLMPDTLDFKFSRFFYRHDIEIVPDPLNLDPQMIADGVARAVNLAHETGKPVNIKLGTIQLGSDAWQRYSICFNAQAQSVSVYYGPVVDTGGSVLSTANEFWRKVGEGRALLLCPVRLDYTAKTEIDIFDGPVFCMDPTSEGKVIPRFIPWHRAWSHSLVISFFAALLIGTFFGLLAGVIAGLAWAAHTTADQFGYMGSSLFYPFVKKRYVGWQLHHSGTASVNLIVVWTACLVIFLNLAKRQPWTPEYFSLPRMFFYGIIAPLGIWRLARWRSKNPYIARLIQSIQSL